MANEKKSPLSGWKKMVTAGVAFVAIVIGSIFGMEWEDKILFASPLILTIIEGVLDFRSRGNGK